MKHKIYILLLLAVISTLILWGCTEKKEHSYFHATVKEVYDNSVLVEPFKDSREFKSADQIMVSFSIDSTDQVPRLEAGTTIRVTYNGIIAESYPAQIHDVFAIELVDAEGNIIEQTDTKELPLVSVISDDELFVPVENFTFHETTETDASGEEHTVTGCGRWLKPQDVSEMPKVPYSQNIKLNVSQNALQINYSFYDEDFQLTDDGTKEADNGESVIFPPYTTPYYVKLDVTFGYENGTAGYQYFFQILPEAKSHASSQNKQPDERESKSALPPSSSRLLPFSKQMADPQTGRIQTVSADFVVDQNTRSWYKPFINALHIMK